MVSPGHNEFKKQDLTNSEYPIACMGRGKNNSIWQILLPAQDTMISISKESLVVISKLLWEREIKFIGLFGDRGHRGPYSPYKPCNHNLYIGIIIFPHTDNPQSTGYN